MDKVNHYEIPADDIERAQKFYEELFDWKISAIPNMPYWSVISSTVDENGKGNEVAAISGGMFKREGEKIGPMIVITVDDIKDKIAKLKERGIEITVDLQEVGDFGLYARFKDPEGNEMGLWQTLKEM